MFGFRNVGAFRVVGTSGALLRDFGLSELLASL